jgi:hypothetical protein
MENYDDFILPTGNLEKVKEQKSYYYYRDKMPFKPIIMEQNNIKTD